MRSIFSVLLILFSLIFLLPAGVGASEVEELRDQISQRNEKIKELEEKIQEYEQTLGNLNEQSSTLENTIASLNTNVDRVEAKIELTKNKIYTARLKIQKIEFEIEEKQQKIQRNKELLAQNIRTIDRRESTTFVELLLKHDNISEFWEKLDSLSQFQDGLKTEIERLQALKQAIEEKKKLASDKKQQLLGYQSELVNEKQLLQNTRQQKQFLLKRTENKESAFQELLAQKRARRGEFVQQLDALESKLQIALNPALLPEKNSQVLSWPTESKRITQNFGRTSASGRLYVSGTHNGLDIGVSNGTPIMASADGVVLAANNADAVCRGASYGRFIFIKHNNGLSTLSAHLSAMSVSDGEKVTRGQIIGYSGASGYVTGPHLHFGVYASQAVRMGTLVSSSCPGAVYHIPISAYNGYLDPLDYLE